MFMNLCGPLLVQQSIKIVYTIFSAESQRRECRSCIVMTIKAAIGVSSSSGLSFLKFSNSYMKLKSGCRC